MINDRSKMLCDIKYTNTTALFTTKIKKKTIWLKSLNLAKSACHAATQYGQEKIKGSLVCLDEALASSRNYSNVKTNKQTSKQTLIDDAQVCFILAS